MLKYMCACVLSVKIHTCFYATKVSRYSALELCLRRDIRGRELFNDAEYLTGTLRSLPIMFSIIRVRLFVWRAGAQAFCPGAALACAAAIGFYKS